MCLEMHICLQIALRQIIRRIYTARSINSIIFLYSTSLTWESDAVLPRYRCFGKVGMFAFGAENI